MNIRKMAKVALFCLVAVFVFLIPNDVEAAGENGFVERNNETYYYSNGDLLTGWQYIAEAGGWYYFSPSNGAMLKNGFYWLPDNNGNYTWERLNYVGLAIDQYYYENGNTYYSHAGPEQGYHQGWMDRNGYSYYFREGTGSQVYGWQFVDGYWRYFRPTGTMMTSTWAWLPINSSTSNWKYFNEQGRSIDQFWNENGSIWLSQSGPDTDYYKGWWTDPANGMSYFFRESSGSQVRNWQFINGKWYFFRLHSGTLAYGKQYIENDWYYLHADQGYMVTGWVTVNGQEEFYESSGKLNPYKAEEQAAAEEAAESYSGYPMGAGSTSSYSIGTFEWMGIINWQGKTFSYYSERVLPGYGLRIPGRYTSDGFVRDGDGYIVLASDYYAKGTIISTPFGSDGKVYDRFGTGQPAYRFDVYTR